MKAVILAGGLGRIRQLCGGRGILLREDNCGFYCRNYPELSEADLQALENCLRA